MQRREGGRTDDKTIEEKRREEKRREEKGVMEGEECYEM